MTRLLLALLLAAPVSAAPTFTVRIVDTRPVDTGRPDTKPVQCTVAPDAATLRADPLANNMPGPCIYPMSPPDKLDWAPYPPTSTPVAVVQQLEQANWLLYTRGVVTQAQRWPQQQSYKAFPFAEWAKLTTCAPMQVDFAFNADLKISVTAFDEAKCK